MAAVQFTFVPLDYYKENRPVKHHSSRVIVDHEEDLLLSQLQLTFPDTFLGASSQATLTITNTSDQPITITGLEILGNVEDFSAFL